VHAPSAGIALVAVTPGVAQNSPTPSTPAAPGGAPSNAFSFPVLHLHSNGVLVIDFDAPGPGLLSALLSASGAGTSSLLNLGPGQFTFSSGRLLLTGPGLVHLRLQPTHAGARLRHIRAEYRKPVRLVLQVAYTPVGGTPKIQTKPLTLHTGDHDSDRD
jgi:hypothetical protein